MLAYVRQVLQLVEVTNALAYTDAALFTSVKRFTVQAAGVNLTSILLPSL